MEKNNDELTTYELNELLLKKIFENSNLKTTIKLKTMEIEKLVEENSKLKSKLYGTSIKNNEKLISMELTEREYFAVEIFKIYYRYLARTPDPEGFLNYYHEVLHGKSLEWVKNQIKSSDEYKKYQ